MKTGKAAWRDALLARRRRVSELKLSGVQTLRELVARLREEGFERPTGGPWKKTAVAADLAALRAEWRADAASSFAAHVEEELAALRAVRGKLWAACDWQGVLGTHDRVALLLGLRPAAKATLELSRGLAIDDSIVESARKRLEVAQDKAISLAVRADRQARDALPDQTCEKVLSLEGGRGAAVKAEPVAVVDTSPGMAQRARLAALRKEPR